MCRFFLGFVIARKFYLNIFAKLNLFCILIVQSADKTKNEQNLGW